MPPRIETLQRLGTFSRKSDYYWTELNVSAFLFAPTNPFSVPSTGHATIDAKLSPRRTNREPVNEIGRAHV